MRGDCRKMEGEKIIAKSSAVIFVVSDFLEALF